MAGGSAPVTWPLDALGARLPPAAGRTDGPGQGPRDCPCPPNTGDMSTAMNFSAKSFTPRPPDKGAFPLDHFGECSAFKEQFMECLRHSGYESAACRQRAMAYLECRMDSWLQVKLLTCTCFVHLLPGLPNQL
ncbi:cytochrome c oxidase assembly protein COX19 isoform X2 [Manacus candei]|uniref:cytochrome c oxidase assembly protein COX19 isoform X2 n=1 Tax=Manacus candei TaxID=415023 RepID=UPI002227D63B|nr:cytochrome c oxidase assembly protein COX19 isoform X2 [Manacus candei]